MKPTAIFAAVILIGVGLAGCTPHVEAARAQPLDAAPAPLEIEQDAASPMPVREEGEEAAYGDDPGLGPDDDEVLLPPGPFQGGWRLSARDDQFDQGLMAFTVQLSEAEAQGGGDYVLFQPFCDAVAGMPITGSTECELIDTSAVFDDVHARGDTLVLEFHPTADGLTHALYLQKDGLWRLKGEYVTDEGRLRLPVVARPLPGTGTGPDPEPEP